MSNSAPSRSTNVSRARSHSGRAQSIEVGYRRGARGGSNLGASSQHPPQPHEKARHSPPHQRSFVVATKSRGPRIIVACDRGGVFFTPPNRILLGANSF